MNKSTVVEINKVVGQQLLRCRAELEEANRTIKLLTQERDTAEELLREYRREMTR